MKSDQGPVPPVIPGHVRPPPLPGTCRLCARTPQVGFEYPLCASCRSTLAQRAVPIWLRIVAGVIAILVVWELVWFPRSVRAARAFDRGKAAEEKGHYDVASREYEVAHAVFPSSERLNFRRAVVLHRVGRNQDAVEALRPLMGRRLWVDEVNAILAEIEQAAKTGGQP